MIISFEIIFTNQIILLKTYWKEQITLELILQLTQGLKVGSFYYVSECMFINDNLFSR